MGTYARLRAELAAQLEETRQRTLALASMGRESYSRRVHPFYSPMGWHFGHVGMTEEFWILTHARGDPPLRPDLAFRFANIAENPREDRGALPEYPEIAAYLDAVRARVLDFLAVADFDSPDPLLRDAYCFRFSLAHEWQHQETMIELLHLMAGGEDFGFRISDFGFRTAGSGRSGGILRSEIRNPKSEIRNREVLIPAGEFTMGSDDPHGYDNERPAHRVFVPAFAIDATPVTVAQYAGFMAEGGYERRELWDDAGWTWLMSGRTGAAPLKPEHAGRYPGGERALDGNEPVCGVNWHEASAYARWCGKRLPSEAEWEKAAAWCSETGQSRRYPWGEEAPGPERADHDAARWGPMPVGSFPAGRSASGVLDMAGGVWEWTGSLFAPYDGFVAFPYTGYSQAHFDGSCRVLRGGSWATRGPLLRCSFRNFYPPHYRQGFLGFRCARSAAEGVKG